MSISIGSPSPQRTELNYVAGKTKDHEFSTLLDQADKTGGDIRSRENKDGSTTYWVSEQRSGLASLFQSRPSPAQRQETLARLTLHAAEAVTRSEAAGGTTAKELLALPKSSTLRSAGEIRAVLGQVNKGFKDFLGALPKPQADQYRAAYNQIDRILGTPRLSAPFGEFMKAKGVEENFLFTKAVNDFHALPPGKEKMQMAERMFRDFIESSEMNPDTVQINLPGTEIKKVIETMALLRTELQEKGNLSAESLKKLDQVFDKPMATVTKYFSGNTNMAATLKAFAKTPAFQEELGRIIATDVNSRSNAANAARILSPGSGADFLAAKAPYAQLESVLADPGRRGEFAAHLSSRGEQDLLANLETFEGLEQQALRDDLSDTELLALLESQLRPGTPAAPGGAAEGLTLAVVAGPYCEPGAADLNAHGQFVAEQQKAAIDAGLARIDGQGADRTVVLTAPPPAAKAQVTAGDQVLSLDEPAASRPEAEDAHQDYINRQLQGLRTAVEAMATLGADAPADAAEQRLFGAAEPAPRSATASRSLIAGFIHDLRNDAANALRPGGLRGFQGAELDRTLANRLLAAQPAPAAETPAAAAPPPKPPPLPTLAEGTLSRIRKSDTPERSVNRAVEAHNRLLRSIDMTEAKSSGQLLKSCLALGRTISEQVSNHPEFAQRPEVAALRTQIREQALSLAMAKDTPASSTADAPPPALFGATKPVDITPTRWLNPLSDTPLDLAGLQGEGDGKKGAQGTTFGFTTGDGRRLIGKTDRSTVKGEVAREFENYQAIYATAGKHPNLGNVHGWADLRLGKLHAEGMLMDRVPGPDGRAFQEKLKEAWDDGVITTEQYWGAVQHVTRVLLEVVEHLGKAGFVHNDLKPENYVIDATTGEPIVIDLGGAARKGEQPGAITQEYSAPELLNERGKAKESAIGTEASDVFTVGSTVQNTVESPSVFHQTLQPNAPLQSTPTAFTRDAAGNAVKTPYQKSADTAYTGFVGETMGDNPAERPTAADAADLPFVADSLLDAAAARAVLQGVASGDLRTAWEARWVAAGKPIPTTEKRYSAPEIAAGLNKGRKALDDLNASIKWSNLSPERLETLQKQVANLGDWVQRANQVNGQDGATEIETRPAEALLRRVGARLAAEGHAVNAAPADPTPAPAANRTAPPPPAATPPEAAGAPPRPERAAPISPEELAAARASLRPRA